MHRLWISQFFSFFRFNLEIHPHVGEVLRVQPFSCTYIWIHVCSVPRHQSSYMLTSGVNLHLILHVIVYLTVIMMWLLENLGVGAGGDNVWVNLLKNHLFFAPVWLTKLFEMNVYPVWFSSNLKLQYIDKTALLLSVQRFDFLFNLISENKDVMHIEMFYNLWLNI